MFPRPVSGTGEAIAWINDRDRLARHFIAEVSIV